MGRLFCSLAVVAATLTAGCANRDLGAGPAPGPTADGGGGAAADVGADGGLDAAADAEGWFLHEEGGEAKLVYGVPDSDAVGLMMTCSPGSGRVTLSHEGPPSASSGLTLASGGVKQTFPGEVEPSQLNSDASLITAEAATDGPVFAQARESGRLAVVEGGRAQPLPATREEQELIRRFLATCA